MRGKRMPLLGAALIILITTLICLAILPTGNKTVDKPNIQTETVKNENVIEQIEEHKFIGPKQPTNEDVKNQKQNKNETLVPTQQPEETSNDSTQNTIDLGQFKITAYCNCTKCCGKWSGGPTASGAMPIEGRTIAVDPSVIPLGTMVIIDGHTYVAEDTGSGIKGNKIDIFFSSHHSALNWGVRYKNVYIAA